MHVENITFESWRRFSEFSLFPQSGITRLKNGGCFQHIGAKPNGSDARLTVFILKFVLLAFGSPFSLQ